MSDKPSHFKPQPMVSPPASAAPHKTPVGRKCKKRAAKREPIAASDSVRTSDHRTPSSTASSDISRKRSATPGSLNESVLSTTLGDKDEYGRAGRVRKEENCVSYYAWRLDRTFKFVFVRESTAWQADAYACVGCKQINPQWETFAYVRDDVFVGVDPSMGHVDHICLESPPRAKQSNLTEEAQSDQTPGATSDANQESASDGDNATNNELEEPDSDQMSGVVSPARQEPGSKIPAPGPLSPFVAWFQGADEEDSVPPPQQPPQNAQEPSLPDEQEQPQIGQNASLRSKQEQSQRGPAPARQDGQTQAPRKSYGQANFLNGARTRLLYASKRYKGVSFRFNRTAGPIGEDKRSWFICVSCNFIISKKNLSSVGVKRCCIVVLDNGQIIGKDPDAGTNHGHLCVEPAKVAELEGLRRSAKGKTKSVDGRVNPKKNVPADRPGPSGSKPEKTDGRSAAAAPNVKQEPTAPSAAEGIPCVESNAVVGNPSKPHGAAPTTSEPTSTSTQAARPAAADHARSSQAPKKRSRHAAPHAEERRDILDVDQLMADLCATAGIKQEVKEELLDEVLSSGERGAGVFAGFPV